MPFMRLPNGEAVDATVHHGIQNLGLATSRGAMTTSLRVSEIFGPTIQGEGPGTGHRAVFLRLSGCNLYCHWCDTPYTWRFTNKHPHDGDKMYDQSKEMVRMPFVHVMNSLIDHGLSGNTTLVITGGEPLLQHFGIEQLITMIQMDEIGVSWKGRIEIETNGTQMPLVSPPRPRPIQYNVSPKLANSGIPIHLRLNPMVIREFVHLNHPYPGAFVPAQKAIFKFVVTSVEDFAEIDLFTKMYEIENHDVYIMPEGIDRDVINVRLISLVEEVIRRGWNLTTRLHVQIWGNRRGV
jgi:7-carboxy-7-deazaguanine synthase